MASASHSLRVESELGEQHSAARDPLQHVSLIWFTVWSSIVHAVIMAVHSVTDPGQMGHLWGDVAALLLTAGVLAALTPRLSSRPRTA